MDDQLRSMLRELGSSQTELDPDRRARIDARVEAAIAGAAPAPASARTHRRVWYVTVVAAAACVAAVLAFSLGPSHEDGSAVSDAPTTEAELVRAVAASPTSAWRDDQVLHQRTIRTADTPTTGEPIDAAVTTTDLFIRRSGDIEERVSDEILTTSSGTSIGIVGATNTYTNFEVFGAAAGFTPDEVASLPTDPTGLVARIAELEAADPTRTPSTIESRLIGLSIVPIVPAEVRAAATQWLLDNGFTLDTATSGEVRVVGAIDGVATTLIYNPQRGVVESKQTPGTTFEFDVDIINDSP